MNDFERQRRRATELVVQHVDCPWCIAKAGELCYAQGELGGPMIRALTQTHMGRFAELGSPAEYIARYDGPSRGEK